MSDVTPKQALVMWCLLARHGRALQKEIVPEVKRSDREALIVAGYISSTKRGSAFLLTVEDRGWRWAGEHLRHELPRGFQAVQDWLTRLHDFLERDGKSLADFIGPAPELPPEPIKRAKRTTSQPTKSKIKPKRRTGKAKDEPSPGEVRARIEEAYLKATEGRKAQSVLLSKVRAELSDLERKTVDAALLRILQGDEKARLGQISDPKALSQADRDAAFNPAGEAFHLLWIQP